MFFLKGSLRALSDQPFSQSLVVFYLALWKQAAGDHNKSSYFWLDHSLADLQFELLALTE